MEIVSKQRLDEIAAETRLRRDNILNSESVYPQNAITYYVDAFSGDDENNGLNADTPWRSLERVSESDLKRGDVVLFKRGCTFRGFLRVRAGVTYSAYGEGEKPKLYGSINAADPQMWIPTKWKNIWLYKNLISYVRDVGSIIFNEGECWGIKVCKNHKRGERCDMGNNSNCDVFNGRRWVHRERGVLKGPQDLKSDLEFYHDFDYMRTSEYLYLYCADGNPGKVFDSIEITVRHALIKVEGVAEDITIDNLCLKYAGACALGFPSSKNLTVRNCEIGFIGGSGMNIESQTNPYGPEGAFTGDLTRMGNAIEIYGTCDGYVVENNYIYQIYDTGITVQVHLDDLNENKYFKNVLWQSNLIDTCHWSFEVWLSTPPIPDGIECAIENFEIKDNICTNTGCGWGETRPDTEDHFMYMGYINSAYCKFVDYNVHRNLFVNNKCSVAKGINFGNKGIRFYDNEIYTNAALGSYPPNFEFGHREFVFYEATDENLQKIVESGCWGENVFKKFNTAENTAKQYFKI